MKKLLGLTIFALISLAILGAGSANAADNPTAPAIAAAAQPGCQPALDLAPAKGQTCPATAAPPTKTPEPEFMVGTRTCRCSCGFPCKTDADCGGALGSCRAGISCC